MQYPNLYLLNRYRESTGSAVDWVVLLISPTLLELRSTLYSPVNAATGSGAHIGDGITGFNQMFMSQPPAKAHQVRTSTHLASCPTSLQAEVLVHRSISASEVVGVVVESDDVIDRVRPFLEKFGRPAPTVYSKFRFFETNFVQTRIELGYEIDLGTRRN